MKRNYCLSLVLLALFGTSSFAPIYASDAEGVHDSQSIQQTRKITGKVVDSAGEPIVGASVLVKEAGTGSVSDLDGKFTVEAAQGYTLMVSFVGYRTIEVKVTNETFYLVTLSDDAQALNEVVVTAMGIKKDRKSLGYAVEDISAEELMKNKSVNPINSLAGKIAGVNITQGGGAAGSGSQIILRGGTSLERDNQPLFVVDGVIYDNSTNILGH